MYAQVYVVLFSGVCCWLAIGSAVDPLKLLAPSTVPRNSTVPLNANRKSTRAARKKMSSTGGMQYITPLAAICSRHRATDNI